MTISQLNNQLKLALKKYIKTFQYTNSKGESVTGHYDTGAMWRSIIFTSKEVEGELKITFKSKQYIQYLDKRQFVKWFFALPTTKAIIKKYVQESPKSQISREAMLKLFRSS